MGFFLAEVAALKIDKCSKLVVNVVNSGIEEERETESGDSAGEVDIMNNHASVHAFAPIYSLPEEKFPSPDPLWDSHCAEKFCPPPEV
jgi:hypothetical protein